jgi:hypothetical protein
MANRKLTETQVIEIIARCASGVPQRQLAKEYGVHYLVVWSIVHNKTYKHVDRSALPAVPKRRREVHGHHGLEGNTYSLTYSSWKAMIQRCTNPNAPNFKWYGGRGITVCDRWRPSFVAFLEDMGERPLGTSIDRIDPNGHYEPFHRDTGERQCRWGTKEEQGETTRIRTSKFQGVGRSGRSWSSHFFRNGERIHIGTYDTELKAAQARDGRVLKFRTGAQLNFPIGEHAHLLTTLDALVA